MCVETYNGCPECNAPYDDIVYQTTAYASVEYPITFDGEPYYGDGPCDEATDLEPSGEGYLYCNRCGHSGFSELSEDLIPDDCECSECEPISQRAADDLIVLARSHVVGVDFEFTLDTPEEFKALLQRRSVWRLPIRRERAEEIMNWLRVERYGWHNCFEVFEQNIPEQWMLQYQIPEPKEVVA